MEPLDACKLPALESTPTISVVTSAWQAAGTLADTLESVRRQQGVSIEHILIDGGSTDQTKEVVTRHGKHLARFVSEPDGGIYDGMNKGARLATGDIIGFLNADDWLAGPRVLEGVARAFSDGADLVYGNLEMVDAYAPYTVRRVWADSSHSPRDFFRLGWQPAHPTTYVRRELFEAWGGFDLRWRIAADYALLARAMREPGLVLHHLGLTTVNMRLGGASTAGPGAIWRANRECAAVLSALGEPQPWRTIAMKLGRKLLQFRVARGAPAKPWRPWDIPEQEAERPPV